MGLAKETIWGTAVAPTVWVPFKTLKSSDSIKRIIDTGIRGNLSKDYASYAGVSTGESSLDGDVYADSFGNFLLGLFGQDTITGTAPYTHSFALSANQPPSYTLSDYDGINERQYTGAMITELGLKFTSDGELTKSAKFVSKASTIASSIHTPTFTTVSPFVGFQAALTIGGTANLNLIGGDLSIKRDNHFTFGANNSQAPTKLSIGKMEVTGKLDFEVSDYSELNYYLNATQPIVVMTFTNGTNVLTVQMSKCDFEKVDGLDRGSEVVKISASIRGLYNATDGGPCLIKLQNSVASY